MRILRNKLEHPKNWQATSVKILRYFSSLPSPGLELMDKVCNMLRYIVLNFGTLKTSTQQFTKILSQDLKDVCRQRRQKAASYFKHIRIILGKKLLLIYYSKIKENVTVSHSKYFSIVSRFGSIAMFRSTWHFF